MSIILVAVVLLLALWWFVDRLCERLAKESNDIIERMRRDVKHDSKVRRQWRKRMMRKRRG